MINFFYPTAYYKHVYEIPFKKLKKNGIKGLVFDIDNTLSPYYEAEPGDEISGFITGALKEGFKVCLLSNNSAKRVKLYSERLKVHSISGALKPSRKGLKRAMVLMETSPLETVIIGDQIFTDVWCGKRAGVRTILVDPCCEKDIWFVKIKRGLEKLIVKSYLESRNVNGRKN